MEEYSSILTPSRSRRSRSLSDENSTINFDYHQTQNLLSNRIRTCRKGMCLIVLTLCIPLIIILILAGIKILGTTNNILPMIGHIGEVVDTIQKNINTIINDYYTLLSDAERMIDLSINEEIPMINDTLSKVDALIAKIDKLIDGSCNFTNTNI